MNNQVIGVGFAWTPNFGDYGITPDDYVGANMQQPIPSYCLDINVGYNEGYRDEIIDLLQRTGAPYEVTYAERGMWQRTKILRVQTPKAQELMEYLIDNIRTGDDHEYEIHYSRVDADRCETWLPDLDCEDGYNPFHLQAAMY